MKKIYLLAAMALAMGCNSNDKAKANNDTLLLDNK